MTAKKRTLHIAIEETLYRDLKKCATDLSFTSAQQYIRYWASCEVKRVHNEEKPLLQSSKAQALRYIELVLAKNHGDFATAQYALHYVARHIQRVSLDALMRKDGSSLAHHQNPHRP